MTINGNQSLPSTALGGKNDQFEFGFAGLQSARYILERIAAELGILWDEKFPARRLK